MPVELVTDGIRAITQEGEHNALEEMWAAGVRAVTTAQVCGSVEGLVVGSPEARA
jgi:hypothetical protein